MELQDHSHAPEARVLIIMTGGTICMRRSEHGYTPAADFLAQCLAPRPSFNDGSNPPTLEVLVSKDRKVPYRSLRTPLSTYNRRVRYAVLEYEELLDSSSIDAKGWTSIATTIYQNYELFDAFVVLHGTDSLAYTSSALSFMLQNLGKTVILTGSQAPMMELQNDATDNLLGSLVIAGHFIIPEVLLFFNYRLFRGNRATKVSASEFAAFDSPNHAPIANIKSDRTHVKWDLVNRPGTIEPFNIQTDLDTAHVACLRIFPGIKPEMVDAVLKVDGLRGLVLETFGSGNAPGGPDSTMTKVISHAVKRGIVIVNVTQCLSGSVGPQYAASGHLARAGVVFGHDLTSEAALTKLSYLLALPQQLSPAQIAAQMGKPLRGELTVHSRTIFQHPGQEAEAQMQARRLRLTDLAYAISHGSLETVKSLINGAEAWILQCGDYLGNTPVHLAAMSSHLDILRFLLLAGGSVHVRNNSGQTPLYLAAELGLQENVQLLREAGAHLHADELSRITGQDGGRGSEIWKAAALPHR